MLLKTGDTCWRVERANRAALIIDMADYFDAAKAAMEKAKRSIHLLNWAFEPETLFHPQPGGGGLEGDRFGNFLKSIAGSKPDVDVRLLVWKSAMPVAATQHFFPLADRKTFAGTKVKFALDGRLPRGACHHQKMIIVDDAVAFCGGGDIGPDRWDTDQHLDDDPRREKTRRDNKCFDSRHEVMSVVDGDAARALGELFRERWLRCTSEVVAEPGKGGGDPWPRQIAPQYADVSVGLSRTQGLWRGYPEVRENERLHLAAIAAAKRCIYMENQYFTSPVIAAALAARLKEPKGPEVVLISAQHSPSYFDQMTMDRTRSSFIRQLQAADKHGRFAIYSPVTALGLTIIVHAKLAIIDDTLLRVGSANINNRSMGFDTECDLSIEAGGATAAATRAQIGRSRTRLLAHWFGCDDAVVDEAIAKAGGVIGGIELLRGRGLCRLIPIKAEPLEGAAAAVAAYHLGDPVGPADAWKPWRRKAALRRDGRAAKRRTRAAR